MYEASTHTKSPMISVDGHTPFGPLYSLSVVDVKLLSKEIYSNFSLFFIIVVFNIEEGQKWVFTQKNTIIITILCALNSLVVV